MLKDKLIIIPFGVTCAIFIISIFLSLGFANYTGKLIINYDLSGGPVLGDFDSILSAVAIFGAIAAINYGLAYVLYDRERFLSYVLSISTPIIGLLLFIMMKAVGSLN